MHAVFDEEENQNDSSLKQAVLQADIMEGHPGKNLHGGVFLSVVPNKLEIPTSQQSNS